MVPQAQYASIPHSDAAEGGIAGWGTPNPSTPQADNGEDSSYATEQSESGGRPMHMRLPATAEQRERIMKDPLVLQALELFEGTIVNMEREVSAGPPEAEEESE